MADFETLRDQQRTWAVRWRWEGQSGHPRRLADSVVQMLEERGYQVELSEGEIKGEPLGNVAEFEGAAIGTAWEARSETLRRKWGYLVAGVVLAPLIAGVFLILYALKRRRYQVGLQWRGEMYTAGAQAGAQGMTAQRANVVSEVRIYLRSAAQEGDTEVKGAEAFRKIDADALPQVIEASVPHLALRPGSGTQPAITSSAAEGDEAGHLPAGERQVYELPSGDENVNR